VNRSYLTVAAAVAVAVAGSLVIRAAADDDNRAPAGREQAFREAERQTSAAYDCMPRDVRRRFDGVVKRYDTRFGRVIDGLPDDTDPADAERALRADPQVARLRTAARGILLGYVPGGDKFERECYERATKRYDRRVARKEPAG
jgi:hypothetical protein